ncbi:MAG: hypothetical protein Q8O88_00965 [bacterium]|nr:hypothetical protein [bacterium]
MKSCFLCEKEFEDGDLNEHWTGLLCNICLESNSHGEPAKLKYLKQNGCICDYPLTDHGLSNNPPGGCWNEKIESAKARHRLL